MVPPPTARGRTVARLCEGPDYMSDPDAKNKCVWLVDGWTGCNGPSYLVIGQCRDWLSREQSH